MEEEEHEHDYTQLKEAGKVSKEALEYAATVVKPGKKLSELADMVEKFIADKGCQQAFPVNLSANDEAAHYTPEHSDPRVVGPKDVIKIDLGARKETYLTDCARTISFDSEYQKLVETNEKALQEVIALVKTGRRVNEIGREIEKAAKMAGYNVIKNLGGHGISQEDLHADIFIPNYDNGDNTELQEGQVIAIEPFLTTGQGYVVEGSTLQIFQMVAGKTPRSRDARDILDYIAANYITYPFAMRWLVKAFDGNEFKVRKAIAELSTIGDLEPFPVLVEKSKGIVSQAEKTLIVEKDSCTIVT